MGFWWGVFGGVLFGFGVVMVWLHLVLCGWFLFLCGRGVWLVCRDVRGGCYRGSSPVVYVVVYVGLGCFVVVC